MNRRADKLIPWVLDGIGLFLIALPVGILVYMLALEVRALL